MKVQAKTLGRVAAALAVLVGIAFMTRGWAVPFLRTNRAEYDNNIGQWRRALKILDELDPEGYRAHKIAYLRMDALVNTGRPYQAHQVWERYRTSRPAGEEAAHEALNGMALMLSGLEEEAAAYFALGEDEYSAVMEGLLTRPTWANYNEALAMTRTRYSRRQLNVAAVQVRGARQSLSAGHPGEALRRLEPVLERYPGQITFMFEYACANFENGEVGLGCSYANAALMRIESRLPEEVGARVRSAWHHRLRSEFDLLVHLGRTRDALGAMRALAAQIDFGDSRALAMIRMEEEIGPAAAFELSALFAENRELGASRRPNFDPLAPHRPWLTWFGEQMGEGIHETEQGIEAAGIRRILRLMGSDPSPMEIDQGTWVAALAERAPMAGRQIIALKLGSAGRGGISAAYSLRIGRVIQTGYVHQEGSWHAFDVPPSPEGKPSAQLRLTNGRLEEIDNLSGGPGRRRLRVLDAYLIDLAHRDADKPTAQSPPG